MPCSYCNRSAGAVNGGCSDRKKPAFDRRLVPPPIPAYSQTSSLRYALKNSGHSGERVMSFRKIAARTGGALFAASLLVTATLTYQSWRGWLFPQAGTTPEPDEHHH